MFVGYDPEDRLAMDNGPGHRASDQVSLRVEAWDADGNRIEQTTRDAFALNDRSVTVGRRCPRVVYG